MNTENTPQPPALNNLIAGWNNKALQHPELAAAFHECARDLQHFQAARSQFQNWAKANPDEASRLHAERAAKVAANRTD